jgi:hypothetical protein
MSVTSSSAKVKFFIGSFDYDTTLTLPATTLENKLTLEIEELISPQLLSWGGVPLPIYALFKVDFNGTEVYKNTDYDSPSTSVAPTAPDITITPDASPATEETIVINNYIPMVTDTDGAISEGVYVLTVKFVYWANATNYASEIGTFTASLDWENKEPSLSEWYDQGTPKLNVTDGQSYVLNGTTADRDTEFVLSPPQNRAEVTNTFDNIQSVNYTNFWTGGNEITYTTLLTYTFTDYIIVNAQQAYKSFTIYYVDNCTIYECLKDQYDLWKSATCGTKVASTAKDTLYEATSIALQITQGTGCNSDELSGLIEDFNELLECDCGCLDSTPRQLGSASTVLATDRQSVTANTATTAIDLSAGSTIAVSVSSNTELDISNIEQYTNYRFIFIPNSGGLEIDFPTADFIGGAGPLPTLTLASQSITILDFYSAEATRLTLVSNSAA